MIDQALSPNIAGGIANSAKPVPIFRFVMCRVLVLSIGTDRFEYARFICLPFNLHLSDSSLHCR